ncbi:hypothetical protein RJT34_12389 [Clitoria ternatea]|uniref:Transmembrane protein n=1 Tax=Clitoria ternatea TaxID=43366 RepID=A0AAN9JM21_CLITE
MERLFMVVIWLLGYSRLVLFSRGDVVVLGDEDGWVPGVKGVRSLKGLKVMWCLVVMGCGLEGLMVDFRGGDEEILGCLGLLWPYGLGCEFGVLMVEGWYGGDVFDGFRGVVVIGYI